MVEVYSKMSLPPIIGAILGHREVSTTQRYAHLSDMPVKRARDNISAIISSAMAGPKNPPTKHQAEPIDQAEVADLISNLQNLLKNGST